MNLTEQAEALYDRLADERARWRTHPVMYGRLQELCRRAFLRELRRRRKEASGGGR